MGSSKKQNGRIVHEGLRSLDPLLHAGRVFLEPAIASVFHPEVGKDLVWPCFRLASAHAVELARQGDVFAPCKPGTSASASGIYPMALRSWLLDGPNAWNRCCSPWPRPDPVAGTVPSAAGDFPKPDRIRTKGTKVP